MLFPAATGAGPAGRSRREGTASWSRSTGLASTCIRALDVCFLISMSPRWCLASSARWCLDGAGSLGWRRRTATPQTTKAAVEGGERCRRAGVRAMAPRADWGGGAPLRHCRRPRSTAPCQYVFNGVAGPGQMWGEGKCIVASRAKGTSANSTSWTPAGARLPVSECASDDSMRIRIYAEMEQWPDGTPGKCLRNGPNASGNRRAPSPNALCPVSAQTRKRFRSGSSCVEICRLTSFSSHPEVRRATRIGTMPGSRGGAQVARWHFERGLEGLVEAGQVIEPPGKGDVGHRAGGSDQKRRRDTRQAGGVARDGRSWCRSARTAGAACGRRCPCVVAALGG